MMLENQLLSNQSTRIKQNSAMSRQMIFCFFRVRNGPIERFGVLDPPFMKAGAYYFY